MNVMFSIETARQAIPRAALAAAGGSATSSALFLFSVFGERNYFNLNLLHISIFIGILGFFYGFYQQYRTNCGSTHAVFSVTLTFFIIEFAVLGGTIAMAVWIAGAPQLRILAVITAAITLLISIAFGMQREARKMKWWKTDTIAYAKDKFAKQIDYTHQTFKALPLEKIDGNSIWKTYGFMIVCVGITNVPLMFQLFTGDRNNVIFLALPLLLSVFVYLNVKTVGRVLFNLILLRRLEASLGYRFINADYEEIQDLRRTFLLSRWLMKDYIKPTADKAKPIKPNKRAA